MKNYIKMTSPSVMNNNEGVLNMPKAQPKSLEKDTFELTEAKQNGKKQKFGIREKFATAVGFGAGIASIAFLIYKNKTSKLRTLPEHIDFLQAKTYEEAIEYGKKVLNIEDYAGFCDKDLDVLNWLNEGMTNMANMHKGKLRMPRKILYTHRGGNVLASMCNKPESPDFGRFSVNKDIFGDIDTKLKKYIGYHNKIATKGINIGGVQCPLSNSEIPKLLDLYNSGKITYNQKIQLFSYIMQERNTCSAVVDSSPYFVNFLLKNNYITNADIGGITFEELLKKTPKEQRNILVRVVQKLANEKKVKVAFRVNDATPFETIYHEFGHLQDMQLRTPAKGKYKNPADYPQELKDWLNDASKIQIANTISPYATTGPGEFIAEVFAHCANGNKLSPEVEKLYNELKGPSLPFATR